MCRCILVLHHCACALLLWDGFFGRVNIAARNVLVREHEPKQEETSLFSVGFSDPVHNFLGSCGSELNREASFCVRWTKEIFLSNVEFLSPLVVIFVFFVIGFCFIVMKCKISETACFPVNRGQYEFIMNLFVLVCAVHYLVNQLRLLYLVLSLPLSFLFYLRCNRSNVHELLIHTVIRLFLVQTIE